MIIADTSGLLSALFPDQQHHVRCADVVRQSRSPLLLSPFVLAELDYLIAELGGTEPELAFLDEVARGAYRLADFSELDIAEAKDVISRYHDLEIGLADASNVILARRFGTADILTLDERDFRVLPGPNGKAFRILPADL